MPDRTKARPADNLDSVKDEFRRFALSAMQNSNSFADFQLRAEWILDRIRSHGNREDLEYLCRELRNFAAHFNQLQLWTKDLETMLNLAASRRIKE